MSKRKINSIRFFFSYIYVCFFCCGVLWCAVVYCCLVLSCVAVDGFTLSNRYYYKHFALLFFFFATFKK